MRTGWGGDAAPGKWWALRPLLNAFRLPLLMEATASPGRLAEPHVQHLAANLDGSVGG